MNQEEFERRKVELARLIACMQQLSTFLANEYDSLHKDKGEEGECEDSIQIFNQHGEPLHLYELARWWIETYPEDVFIGTTEESKEIVEIRKHFQAILGRLYKAKEPPVVFVDEAVLLQQENPRQKEMDLLLQSIKKHLTPSEYQRLIGASMETKKTE